MAGFFFELAIFVPMFLFAAFIFALIGLIAFGARTIPAARTKNKKKALKKSIDQQLLAGQVPQAAASYCVGLWREHGFTLRIKGDRKTKLGDFRVDRTGAKVSVSVNGTLNPYAFLLTYLHEVAHLLTWQQHKASVKPHGPEWQQNFRLLMAPLLTKEVFPLALLKVLEKYMQAPAASSASYQPLWLALRAYDQQPENENLLLLKQVPDGTTFRFSDVVYRKVEVRRTRALCHNIANGRRYLISTAAQVELVA